MGGGTLDSTSATKHNYTSADLDGFGFIKRPFTNSSGSITASGGTLQFLKSRHADQPRSAHRRSRRDLG